MKKLLCALVLLCTFDAAAIPRVYRTHSAATITLENFYKTYLEKRSAQPPFTRAFAAAIAENDRLCQQSDHDEVCGWQAQGNPYLDGQDFGKNLTYDQDHIKIMEIDASGKIQVRLNPFPEKKNASDERIIIYKMTMEDGHWVVDDIFTNRGQNSMRKLLQDENSKLSGKK